MTVGLKNKNLEKVCHECFIKVQAVYNSLKSAERKAANLLLERPDFFAEATIVEAAGEAGCSEATLFRLARRLGYKGYPELKQALMEGKLQGQDGFPGLYNNIAENDSPTIVAEKVFQASVQALNDTLRLLDQEAYDKAVIAICNAERIVICGTGDAGAVAQTGYQKFLRIGLNVKMSWDFDLQLIDVSQLREGDVLIVISHTGKTKTILEVVKQAKTVGATVIAITNFPLSPLTKHSHIVLLTAAFDEHVTGEIISKRITELCMIETLFVNVLRRRTDLQKNLDLANAALKSNKF